MNWAFYADGKSHDDAHQNASMLYPKMGRSFFPIFSTRVFYTFCWRERTMNIFARDYTGGQFVMFGPPHVAVLAIILSLCIGLFLFRSQFSETGRRVFRWVFAILLIVNELSWHLWNASVGNWTIQTMLPLHLCSVMVYASAVMLVYRTYTLYEFLYFLGIAAASQALLTPDLGVYGFPHYRFFQTFLSHGSLLIVAVYMTVVESYRPRVKSLLKVIIGLNLYMVFVACVNFLIGSNYLFIAHKPETPSLIDMLGPWPWYILGLEGIGIAMCCLLYIPFLIKDRIQKQ
jgi:hypothetical integral membrane protein (TIGR02206 family)